jgi:hypothetical protein
MKSTLKSAGAIVAGLVTVGGLSTLTDLALAAVGFFPPITTGTFLPWMFALALFYRVLYAVLGGAVSAALAPRWPMRHAIVLGILGTIAGVGGVVAGWGLGDMWYPVGIAVTAFPAVYLGGYLFNRRGTAKQ